MIQIKTPQQIGIDDSVTGIYIMTDVDWIPSITTTGTLQFGIGDTVKGSVASRLESLSSSKNPRWKKYLIDVYPNPGYRDHKLHRVVRNNLCTQLCDPTANHRRSELFEIKVDENLVEYFKQTGDFEAIRQWLVSKIRACASSINPSHARPLVKIRDTQESVIGELIETISENGIECNVICELAARIGKTILFLSLADRLRSIFGHQSMFIMAYGVGLSVKTSYYDEILRYQDFNEMRFIDATSDKAEHEYTNAIQLGLHPIVFVSLNPSVEHKYQWINKLSGTHVALLEETDFGSHTDAQVKKVDFLLANKKVTRINASGTNIGRIAKAFGKNKVTKTISVPYCMVEQDQSIPDVVRRKFYNMSFDDTINDLLNDYDPSVLPSFKKILEKPLAQEKFITALFKDMFGYQPIYGFNISDCADEEIMHSMCFVNVTKRAMEQLAKVIERACTEHRVLVLNGDHTSNKEAEELTKEELTKIKNGTYGQRNKLLVVTDMMGTRSFSVPEIQACIFMQDGGDVYPYMQKYSRCLTPGSGKSFGHIFDFAFDQSKTRNSVMSVAIEASLLLRNSNEGFTTALRRVLNSVNIKDMVSGKWISVEDIILQFEDNDRLLEVANAGTRISEEELTDEEFTALVEIARFGASPKTDKSMITKVVDTGKTFAPFHAIEGTEKAKPNPRKKAIEDAIRRINSSATTVLAMANYQGSRYMECIDVIASSKILTLEFTELFGVGPETIKLVARHLQIATLDMIVVMSKNNQKQHHVKSNHLSILKDPSGLWHEVLSHNALEDFIRSDKCKSILIVAGGHGTEVDVLVEKFGADIINKITFNDKYEFFCNQVRYKYPKINLLPGDFKELNIDMKFDVVIGNPPFQEIKKDGNRSNQAANLWAPFWKLAIKRTKRFCTLVTPVSWISPSRDFKNDPEWKGFCDGRLWNVFDKFTTVADISPRIRESFFPTIGSSFGYAIVDVNGCAGLSFTTGNHFNHYGFHPDPKKTDDEGVKIIEKNITSLKSESLEHFFKIDQECTTDLKVAVPLTKTKGFAELVQIIEGQVVPNTADGLPVSSLYDPDNSQVKLFLYIHVPDMKTAIHVKNRIIECEKILTVYCRWSGFMNIQICKMIKLTP